MKTTFSKTLKGLPGNASYRYVEVSRNGRPLGLLWTWLNTADTKHPWHAKPLNGRHHTFRTLALAKRWMEGHYNEAELAELSAREEKDLGRRLRASAEYGG